MADFLTGHTYSVSEQVTNTKMNNQVNLASISNIQATELATNFLQSLPSATGRIPPQNIYNLGSAATNASLIDVSSAQAFNIYASTFSSLATFINARVGQPFTLFIQQASFPCLVTLGNFKLSGNFIPRKQYDNITLFWNGSVFVETARTLIA
jgi:hypothetical protein